MIVSDEGITRRDIHSLWPWNSNMQCTLCFSHLALSVLSALHVLYQRYSGSSTSFSPFCCANSSLMKLPCALLSRSTSTWKSALPDLHLYSKLYRVVSSLLSFYLPLFIILYCQYCYFVIVAICTYRFLACTLRCTVGTGCNTVCASKTT